MEQLADLLSEGANDLGLDLDSDQLEALRVHLELLAKWNAKLNLVGPGTMETWAARHTLDSLAIVEWIERGAQVADVGSGAGFPGIPCAVAQPAASFVLLEPRANRAAFLQNALAATSLRNARVHIARAESETNRFDLVAGRAVAPPPRWSALASKLCSPGGGFVLFSSEEPPLNLGTAERRKSKEYGFRKERRRSVALYVPRGT